MRTGYSTDLTDAEWNLILPFLPPLTGAGAPRTVDFLYCAPKTGRKGEWK